MADSNSSLPVKTLNNGDIAAKIVDGTVTSQALSVDSAGRVGAKISDAAGNALTSQTNGTQRALDVGINVAGVQIDPRSIRALTSADVVTANQGAAGAAAWLTKDAANGSATGGTAAPVSELAGGIFNTVAPTLTSGQQAAIQLDASGNVKTAISQPLPAGTNIIGAVNLDLGSTPISATNPLPVILSVGVAGAIVNNYNTAASVAAGAVSNHTYTITTGKSFQGKKIHAASSGALKIEVQTSADGTTFTTVFVAFNSVATPNIDIDMDEILFLQNAGTGAAIRVIRTNREQVNAEDVYSTISGVEV